MFWRGFLHRKMYRLCIRPKERKNGKHVSEVGFEWWAIPLVCFFGRGLFCVSIWQSWGGRIERHHDQGDWKRERERERASNELCSSSCFSMFSTSSLAAEKLSVGIEQVWLYDFQSTTNVIFKNLPWKVKHIETRRKWHLGFSKRTIAFDSADWPTL